MMMMRSLIALPFEVEGALLLLPLQGSGSLTLDELLKKRD